jgi:hypothetical protein
MNTFPRYLVVVLATTVAAGLTLLVGCEAEQPPKAQPKVKAKTDPTPPVKETPPPKVAKVDPPKTEDKKPETSVTPAGTGGSTDTTEKPPDDGPMPREKPLYKEPPAQEGWKRSKPLDGPRNTVWLETQGDKRRVLVAAIVCLREGSYGLECLLCKRGTKEHESILVTTADASLIHFALEAAKIKPGSTVQYEPKFMPPKGDKVKVTLLFEEKGKWQTTPAQKWIRHTKTKKDLEYDWVFAGSGLYKNKEDPEAKPVYLANNDGGVICIANVHSAMMDLPIDSPKGIEGRMYEPNTKVIPPLDTSVTIILEPVEEKKK